jgi:hypothetical protein
MVKRKTLAIGTGGFLLVAGVIVVIVLAALGYFNKKGGGSGGGTIIPASGKQPWGPSPNNPGGECQPFSPSSGVGGLDPVAKKITIENVQIEIVTGGCPTPSTNTLTGWFEGDFHKNVNIDSVQQVGQSLFSINISCDASNLTPRPQGYTATLYLSLSGIPIVINTFLFKFS